MIRLFNMKNILFFLVVIVFCGIFNINTAKAVTNTKADNFSQNNKVNVEVFIRDGCQHCHDELFF